MINDPAKLYYYTGMGGVVLPNEEPEIILEIARRYQVSYLLLEEVSDDRQTAGGAPSRLWPILTELPDFLEPVPLDSRNARLYAIRYERLP
jgi:hypothetical protein